MRKHPFGEGDFVMTKRKGVEVWDSEHIQVRMGPVYGVLADNVNPRWRIFPDAEDVINQRLRPNNIAPGYTIWRYDERSGRYKWVHCGIYSVEVAKNLCEWKEIMYLMDLGGVDDEWLARRDKLTEEEWEERNNVLTRVIEMGYLDYLRRQASPPYCRAVGID